MAHTPEQGYPDLTLSAIRGVAETMGGVCSPEGEYVTAPQEPDYTERSAQRVYMGRAMAEADQLDYKQRTVFGPHHAIFNECLKGIADYLYRIDRRLTPDYLAPAGYRTDEVHDFFQHNSREKALVEGLREQRLRDLYKIGYEIAPQLEHQELPIGLLDAPPHHRQGEEVAIEKARLLCVNACFRMVHEGIVGWAPEEDILAAYMDSRHKGAVPADEDYFKLFQTEAFKEASNGRMVKIVELLGADFATINKLTAGIKAKHPNAQVYAVASIGSETALDQNVWHTVVLRGIEDGEVISRDPSPKVGSSRKHMPVRRFLRQWAVAYNRVQMVITL